MSNNSKVPQIRFKGFTEDWEQCKLKNIFTEVVDNRGKTPPLSNEGIPLIEIASVGEHDVNYERVSKFLSDYSFANNLRNYLLEGDLLFSTVGTTALTSVYKSNVNSAVAQNIIGLRSKNCYPSFLHYLISNSTNNSHIKTIQMTGVQFSIKVPQLLEVDLLVSKCYQEQLKIGTLLANLDHIVTLHQRKYDKLVNIKKALLERMFPQAGETAPAMRFKGFTDAWQQRKLKDVVDRITRKNQDLESTLPLTISAQYGLIDQNEFFDKRIASKDVSGYYLVKNGEFAYNKSTSNDAPWGAIKRLDRYINGVLSTLYIVFGIIDRSKTDSNYIVSYYDTELWHKGIQAIAAEGARNHGLLNISPADFFETEIMLPKEMQEQELIGTLFSNLDNLITLHQRKLEKLKNIKRALLAKMFVQ